MGLLAALGGCAVPAMPARYQPPVGPRETVYVTAQGWHTGLALRTASISRPLAILRQDFPGARYLWFGWGQREYYMAAHPTVWDALRALLPGPAVVYVIPLSQQPQPAGVGGKMFPVSITPAGFRRLTDDIAASLARSPDGQLRWAGSGFWPGSAFFASTQTYDAAHTCNTWTAKALQIAGLPVRATGVIFANQVVAQIRPIAAADQAVSSRMYNPPANRSTAYTIRFSST